MTGQIAPFFRSRNAAMPQKDVGSVLLLARVLALVLATAACAPLPLKPSPQHVSRENAPPRPVADIPPPVFAAPLPPPPQAAAKPETFSVVVNEVPVRSLLFALARDAKLNVDIHPSISGSVTLNAISQTMPQLLERISQQVSLRYTFDDGLIAILPDDPYPLVYKIDYVNLNRDTVTSLSLASEISTSGRSGAAQGGGGSNNSSTEIRMVSSQRFWDSLAQNLCSILTYTLTREERETARTERRQAREIRLNQSRAAAAAFQSQGNAQSQSQTGVSGQGFNANSQSNANLSSANQAQGQAQSNNATAASAGEDDSNPCPAIGGSAANATVATRTYPNVMVSRESGTLTINGTSKQHKIVRQFIESLVSRIRRQVLIEATVVEVQLSGQYQQGINWQRLRLGNDGFSITQQPGGTGAVGALPGGAAPGGGGFGAPNVLTPGLTNPGATNRGLLQVSYINPGSSIGNIAAALSLLESFGNVKVLSSPKLSVLNNQTALLKVVDNRVYFTVTATVVPSTVAGVAPTVAYNTTPNTVPVGFVMAVTPQIDDADQVTMNVRPSISRILRFVNDPNPQLALANVTNLVPEIQTREIESILKVNNNQIAVMGGLMQDDLNNGEDAVPGLGRVPVAGELFRYRNERSTRSELVIFLRPIVIKDPSLDGDFQKFREFLPGHDFFDQPNALKPAPIQFGSRTQSNSSGAGQQ